MANKEVVLVDTRSAAGSERLSWINEPKGHKVNATRHGAISLFMDGETDFWRKTYYTPELIKDNGHFLYYPVNLTDKVVAETRFTLNPAQQFDQAGLMIRYNQKHWLKTGIEYVDGGARLSCVVTNDFSDWSTQDWPSKELAIRVYKLGADIVVEAEYPQKNNTWDFFRIARLHVEGNPEIMVGMFGCAPKGPGGSVLFNYFQVKETDGYHHHS